MRTIKEIIKAIHEDRPSLTDEEVQRLRERIKVLEEQQAIYEQEVTDGLHPAEMTIADYRKWQRDNQR